jgi:hypothetical protein
MTNITKALNFNSKPQKINARNVLQRLHTIPISVKRYYTDINGTVIAKAAAPAILQTRFPVFLLGEFDRQAGYDIGRKILSPEPGTYFLQCFSNGFGATSTSIIGINALNTIQALLKFGDVVMVYTDSINNPTAYVWFVVSSFPSSMTSILANSKSTQNDNRLGRLAVYEINYKVSDSSQFSEDFHMTRYDNIANYNDNTVQPLGIYRSIMDKQTDLIRLKLVFDIDQFLGINFYFLYANDSAQLDLNIVKF